MPIDPRSDRPVYHQIADELRDRILARALAPGEKLPSETELVAAYGTTRTTVRQALRVLASEGLTFSRRGVGVFVRGRGSLRPRMAQERFARRHRQAGMAALAWEAEQQGKAWRAEILELGEVPAPTLVAARFAIPEGEPVFVRRRRIWVDEVPMQLADSYFLRHMAAGTRITQEDTGPGGVYARLEERGHRLTRFTEDLSFRMPTPGEVRSLDLPAGVPVVDLVRVAYAAKQAVEVLVSVLAGDKHVFSYEIPAD
ncbi:MAG: GntR family transcriptional regulator [Egibacteraceae bacterium]